MRANILALLVFAVSTTANAAAPASASASASAQKLSTEDQRLYYIEKYYPGCLEQTDGAQAASRGRELVRRYSRSANAPANNSSRSAR